MPGFARAIYVSVDRGDFKEMVICKSAQEAKGLADHEVITNKCKASVHEITVSSKYSSASAERRLYKEIAKLADIHDFFSVADADAQIASVRDTVLG